ncbi:hypothetical protein LTR37_004413 [Vermiconidia calcicola]|uniref:Uncharacterized protein n=1 Tax=Vermiconidia calcicola TaxID=1690605 RepID=A0ACC3NN58_9PEZI|nr:hypothetical protein LTR37_004413 [Vermiconidia calcicola]
MKSNLALLAFAAGSQALVSRQAPCCFGLTAYTYDGPAGAVGQLSDGQNRIGQEGLPEGSYCINSNGGLTDGEGRGCIWTPPTTQNQCDVGAKPDAGFEVGCNGTVSYKGGSAFYACDTGDNGGKNIYSEPLKGEPTCQPIWLVADDCKTNCVLTSTITADCTTSSPVPPASTNVPPPPKNSPPPQPPKAECPGVLEGN